MSNCLFEATYEQILEKCECAPGFHTLGGDVAMRKFEICQGKSLNCMNSILNRMGEFDEVHVDGGLRRQRCRAACEDQINSMFITTSKYPNRETFQHQEEFCIITNRLISKCNSDKRKPLMKKYPRLCSSVEPLEALRYTGKVSLLLSHLTSRLKVSVRLHCLEGGGQLLH